MSNPLDSHDEEMEHDGQYDEIAKMFRTMFRKAEHDMRVRMLDLVQNENFEFYENMERTLQPVLWELKDLAPKLDIIREIPIEALTKMAADYHNQNEGTMVENVNSGELATDEVEERRSWKNERNEPKRPRKLWDKIQFPNLDTKYTEGSPYTLWRDKIVSEVRGQGCDFLLEQNAQVPDDISGSDLKILKFKVRSFIIRHLDEMHHAMVQNDLEPSELMQKLDRKGNPQSSYTGISAFTRITRMLYNPSVGKVAEFITVFDSLVTKLATQDNPLTEQQQKQLLIYAFGEFCPKLSTWDNKRFPFTVSDIKEAVYEEENKRRDLEEKELVGRALYGSSAKPTNTRRQPPARERRPPSANNSYMSARCYKCDQLGHYKDSCPTKEVFCYGCHKMADHVKATCPVFKAKFGTVSKTQSANPATSNSRGPNQKKDEQKQPGQNQSGGKKKFTRFRKKDVKRLNGNRQQQGRAQIAMLQDGQDDEETVLVDASELGEYELQELRHEVGSSGIGRQADGEDQDDQMPGNPVSLTTYRSKCRNPLPKVSFILDSGSTDHLCNTLSGLVNVRRLVNPKRITCANGSAAADLVITLVGDMVIGDERGNVIGALEGILYAPSLIENLFSLSKLITNRVEANFTGDGVEVTDMDDGSRMASGVFDGRFWTLSFTLPLAPMSAIERDAVLADVNLRGRRRGTVSAHLTTSTQEEPLVETRGSHLTGSNDTTGNDDTTDGGMNETDLVEISRDTPNSLRSSIGLLWHMRLNHTSKRYLEKMGKQVPQLEKVKFTEEIIDCSACKLAKARKQPSSGKRKRSNQPFHRLYSDLLGPVRPSALRTQARYIVTFTCDYSRYAMAYAIKNKTMVHDALSEFLRHIRCIKGPSTKVSELRVDGGTEYQTSTMKSLLQKEDICLTVCEPHTPEHNACSERLNLELETKMAVNLISAKMPHYYWEYTMRHVMFVHNRTPNAANEYKSPYELVYGDKPELGFVRRFGCEAFILNLNKRGTQSKLDPRSSRAFLLECNETGYTLVQAKDKVIVKSKHVEFVESKVFGDYFGPDSYLPMHEDLCFETSQEPVNLNESWPLSNDAPVSVPTTGTGTMIGENDDAEFYLDDGHEANIAFLCQKMESESQTDPCSYQAAINCKDSENWIEAMHEEFDAHMKCETWKLIPRNQLPKGTKILKARWVNKRKHKANGSIRYRSRLVAKGFADKNTYDRTEIYAPVARLSDVRFLIILANKFDLDINQYDVRTAFLNGTLEKKVFMEMPEGLSEYLNDERSIGREKVCELKKALYGLKVSSKRWFIKFQEVARRMEFDTYEFQSCLFVWRDREEFAVMLLYVDDILVTSNSGRKLAEMKRTLQEEFDITDLGEPTKFLGLELIRNRMEGYIFLHQKSYIDYIISKFLIGNENPVSIPMECNRKRKRDEMENEETELTDTERRKYPFREIIGSLH